MTLNLHTGFAACGIGLIETLPCHLHPLGPSTQRAPGKRNTLPPCEVLQYLGFEGRLNPITAPACEILGWKMHKRTCKRHIFRSYNTSAFNAMHFDETPFSCEREKKEKRIKGFKFGTLFVVLKGRHGNEGVNLLVPPTVSRGVMR